MQLDIFSEMYPNYKIKKPIRLIELFAGYGSQKFALEYLGIKHESHKICEWAVKSIQAYNDAHIRDYTDYAKDLSKEELTDKLFAYGISFDYSSPMSREQIARKPLDWLKNVYNNIIATKNIVNVCNVAASDLEINDTDVYDYIMTYSFPCQDLSLAGHKKGMAKNSGTRSGLLWEVERILFECKNKPQILLMENVPQVHSTNDFEHFHAWQQSLEKMGYKNYWSDLNSKNYEIPQNRNRCFMISILGNYSYSFPKKYKLKLYLKDLLEDNVNEKYFLSDKMINVLMKHNNKIIKNDTPDISATIHAGYAKMGGRDQQYIKEDIEVFDYRFDDGVRGRVEKGICPTLTTKAGSKGLSGQPLLKENFCIDFKSSAKFNATRDDGLCGTLDTTPKFAVFDNKYYRIRKLTPKECFRLMGVKDEDFEHIAKNQSQSSLYHLAGDSIVVNVLMAIFKELI